MNMRNKDIKKLLNGKTMTGRPVNFNIKTGKYHKFISDRRYGAFGKAFIEETFICKIKDLNQNDLKMLGYSSIEEYLAEPFNKEITENSKKKFIRWSNFIPNWETLNKLNWY